MQIPRIRYYFPEAKSDWWGMHILTKIETIYKCYSATLNMCTETVCMFGDAKNCVADVNSAVGVNETTDGHERYKVIEFVNLHPKCAVQ